MSGLNINDLVGCSSTTVTGTVRRHELGRLYEGRNRRASRTHRSRWSRCLDLLLVPSRPFTRNQAIMPMVLLERLATDCGDGGPFIIGRHAELANG